MSRYILRRLWTSVPVILLITAITFLFISLAPGDPIDAMIDPNAMTNSSPEAMEALRERLGLNDPVPVRYVKWLGQLVQGNLGYSYYSGMSVTRVIGTRLQATFLLMAVATSISLSIGVVFGIISALRQYSWIDYVLTTLAFFSVSMPGFFAALAALYIFSLKLDLFPTYGMMSRDPANPTLDVLLHLVLPATVLGLEGMATYLRYTRSSLLEVIRQDYVTTARAKGLAESVVIIRHAFRNALIPVITIIGLQLPRLFGGAVIIETIFAWPGMGLVSIESVTRRDYPVLMGINLLTAFLVLSANLITDITYAFIDPRIRYG